MKNFLRSLLVISGLTAAFTASAAETADCCKPKDAAACCGADKACCQSASTKANAQPSDYPLTTCVVSGDKLGDMGEPFVYVHKQDGQPDRTVLLCCKGCVKDFQKEPAKYLKLLDEAAGAKKKA
jgi:hypothetical protein